MQLPLSLKTVRFLGNYKLELGEIYQKSQRIETK